MRSALTALVLAAVLAFAAGCGESEQEQAREVVQDYVDASNGDDFEAICDLYSESLKQELAIGENCAAFVQEQSTGADGSEELELIEVRVNDDQATADIDAIRESEGPSRITLQLEREGDDWRVSGFQ